MASQSRLLQHIQAKVALRRSVKTMGSYSDTEQQHTGSASETVGQQP